ncbi:MAG: CobD/CbiB family protein [Burkholderiales bacterium]|jgi:adenosylcobinamide-phosphate synthase|nr:CobD/CbiB family protein [Burkholderiales bacterium]MBP6249839.1 CobD/CbiB family protein [Leptothrix sp. (in: b-proteobacteria)]MBP7520281.1 CobD/CbiB family protein [Leptothrix sp. (in: b-proteobacteria)]
MSFLAVLLALFIEQLRPLPQGNPVHEGLIAWVRWTGRNFDAGREHHAWVVWAVSTLLPALVAWSIFALLFHFSALLALVWNLVVLYLSLGFRQFSHYFTDIREALEQGDETRARALLQEWRHLDASELPRTELLRHVIEHALLAAHRHVFGVFFWFVLGSALGLGPAGAVFYRMAEFSSRYWSYKSHVLAAPTNQRLMLSAQQAFAWIDRVPARLTAAGFAVVGNFEDAIDCWRQQARLWKQDNDGVLLAAAAGAVGIALGGQSAPEMAPDRSRRFDHGALPGDATAEGSTPGAPPQIGHLRSVVGLVWRSMVLWMLLLALLSLANLLG